MSFHLLNLQPLRTKLQHETTTSFPMLQAAFLVLYLLLPPLFSWYTQPDYFTIDTLLSLTTFVAMLFGGYIGFRTSNQPYAHSTFVQVIFAVTWRLTVLTLFFGLIFFYALGEGWALNELTFRNIDMIYSSITISALLLTLPLAIQYVSLKPVSSK